MTAAGDAKRERDSKVRARACLDREVTHIRVGDWRSALDCTVELVGFPRDLHGTVCTCCPRRSQEAA